MRNVRAALEKLKQKPESAVLFGFDEEAVRSAIACRSTKTVAKKESLWRGKANWPAALAATKKSVTASELVRACNQHYIYKSGKYIIDPDYTENIEYDYRVVIKDAASGVTKRTRRGRPTIPTSFKS